MWQKLLAMVISFYAFYCTRTTVLWELISLNGYFPYVIRIAWPRPHFSHCSYFLHPTSFLHSSLYAVIAFTPFIKY